MRSAERIALLTPDPDVVADLAGKLSVSPTLATLLVNRGYTTWEECRHFFRATLDDLHDPFLFSRMNAAVERIERAAAKRERIIVYGDYDVDGISATALVLNVFEALGIPCEHYLPNRLTSGYGLSMSAVDECAAGGGGLLITVDCATTACGEVEHAAARGLDVIVTDHHEPKAELPRAAAIINPKVPGSGYPDTSLAGVGVAFKLCQALAASRGLDRSFWRRWLDLVALGTAADIVPLRGENRILVKEGLAVLKETEHPGLRELMALQQIDTTALSTSQVVFRIAPCLNAAGRLGDPNQSLALLRTTDTTEARRLAAELKDANNRRRAIEAQVVTDALEWIDAHADLHNDYALVVAGTGWHQGVIGIVASKIVERHHRPAIVLSIDENGVARGSGRSIPALHLTETLSECDAVLDAFGGHAAAAGMSLSRDHIDTFRRAFNDAVKTRLSAGDLVHTVHVDTEIELEHCTPKFFSILEQMAPFGPGNRRPLFVCRGLRHRYGPRVVGSNHLKMHLHQGGRAMNAIAFNFGGRHKEISDCDGFTCAFSLDENRWNGKTTLQMNVKGVEI